MPATVRSLTLLTAICVSLPAAIAHAQNGMDENRDGLPQRLEQFGRSLVGKRQPQRPMPQQQQQQQQRQMQPRGNAQLQQPRGAQYDAGFGEDDAPRQEMVANDAPPMARQPAPASPQQRPTSSRRTVDQSQAPVATGPRRPGPPSKTTAPATDAVPAAEAGGVPHVARATTPTSPEAPLPAAIREPAESDTLVVRRASPSISVETIGPRKISVGKQAAYKLVLKNAGDLAAKDVVVTILVPDFAEVVDAKGTGGAAEPATGQDGMCWKLASLVAGGREELTLDIVPRKSQPFDLDVRWTQAPLASQTTVEVQEPKLALALEGAKEVTFGERSLYKLRLNNPGTGDAENVIITLYPINSDDGPAASHSVGMLRPGESKTIEVELIVRQGGQVTIHAEATAAGDIKTALEEEVVVRHAALAVAVHAPKMQFAGTPAGYEIHVKNTGNAQAQNLKVNCRLPRQAEFVACSSSGQHEEGTDVVQWTVASLEPNAEVTLSAQCVLHAPGANKLEITCLADREVQQAAVAATHVEAVADLAMSVVDPSGPVPVGTDMIYEIHIRNRGTKSAEAIDVLAYFSKGVEPVAVEGGPHELRPGMVLIQTIPSLEAGREVVYKLKARAETPGTHRFRAELTCKPLDTKLTEEEATLFYSEANDAQ